MCKTGEVFFVVMNQKISKCKIKIGICDVPGKIEKYVGTHPTHSRARVDKKTNQFAILHVEPNWFRCCALMIKKKRDGSATRVPYGYYTNIYELWCVCVTMHSDACYCLETNKKEHRKNEKTQWKRYMLAVSVMLAILSWKRQRIAAHWDSEVDSVASVPQLVAYGVCWQRWRVACFQRGLMVLVHCCFWV